VFREISDKIYANNIGMHESMAKNLEIPKGIFPVIRSGNVDDLTLICNNLGISNHNKSDEKWVKARINNNSIDWRKNEIQSNLVPDVTGMTFRDALYILENNGVIVDFEGKGRVVKQSVAPGKLVKNNFKILLKLG
jgi:cell division protein FtsI (penicillin-binding protein 3)